MGIPNPVISSALTREELREAFGTVGVRPGMTLEVHSSLKGFGYIVGFAQTVVDALMDAVGFEGTLVMPLQAGDNSEPSAWHLPPADPELWPKIRDNFPAFDPVESDVRKMGALVNNFRRRQGVYFTRHPMSAFAAYGKYAKLVCSHQNLNFSLNEQSPIGQLSKLNARVLLLGVSYDNCTGMHLAEYQSRVRPILVNGSAIDRGNGREWVKYLDIDLDSSSFLEPGRRMEKDGLVKTLKVNGALIRLFKLNDALRYARDYLIREEA